MKYSSDPSDPSVQSLVIKHRQDSNSHAFFEDWLGTAGAKSKGFGAERTEVWMLPRRRQKQACQERCGKSITFATVA